jgi:exodeoxyribonuclease V alpha subunit
MPHIDSPFQKPEVWLNGSDCLFIDAEEATTEQLKFIARVKRFFGSPAESPDAEATSALYEFRSNEPISPYETEWRIPKKFQHVDIDLVLKAQTGIEELRSVIKKVHPWSSLHYGLTASDVVRKLFLEWIPKYFGDRLEIQVISPMTRGSLGTLNLNRMIQESANPPGKGKSQLLVGEKILRVGDRVIHRRNNYELGVFNGDIGVIRTIDNEELSCRVCFSPDGREILYQRDHIQELDLAYAITIHKSQGSEFDAVIMPVLSQHFKMLFRNLIYTGLTRARKLAVLVGTRRALAMAVRNQDTSRRQTSLQELLNAMAK